jgi:hypothetical protein
MAEGTAATARDRSGESNGLFLRVALRGEDLAAISALEVFHDEMGARDLANLSRETVWEIVPEGPQRDSAERASPRERLAAIARESLLFANPVKERWTLEDGPLRLARAAGGRRTIGLLVRDRPDRAGPACARTLAEAWGLRASVRRATLWLLDLPDLGPERTAARARALGIATRRDQGLLVNPHYQDHEILIDSG